MKRSFWLVVIICLVTALVVEGIFIVYSNARWTESASAGGQALTGIVALLVVVSFLNERIKNRNDSALEAVRLFLTEVNPIHLKISEIKIEQYKDVNFGLPRIVNVEDFNVGWMKANRQDISQKHVEFQGNSANSPLLLESRILLNQYEYVSLFIRQRGIEFHTSVSIIKEAFVADIEQQAFLIATNRLIVSGLYPNIIWLYGIWRHSVDRTTIEEKVELLLKAQ